MTQWLHDPIDISFTPLADARQQIKAKSNVGTVGSRGGGPVAQIVVYGSTWLPTSRSTLIAAKEFMTLTAHDADDDRNTCSVICIDAQGHQDWYAENNLVVGAPCVQIYYRGKKCKLRAVNQSKQPPCSPMVLSYIYVGPMTIKGMTALADTVTKTVITAPPGESVTIDIDLGTVCAA
eukprot:PhF_6_TR24300/c0_g1_i1/m.33738